MQVSVTGIQMASIVQPSACVWYSHDFTAPLHPYSETATRQTVVDSCRCRCIWLTFANTKIWVRLSLQALYIRTLKSFGDRILDKRFNYHKYSTYWKKSVDYNNVNEQFSVLLSFKILSFKASWCRAVISKR